MAITSRQLDERLSYIGSSDAAAILGASRWNDAAGVRARKLGLLTGDDAGKKARIGTLLEEPLRTWLGEELGQRVVASTATFKHTKLKCIAANLDGFVMECKRGNPIAEFKASDITEGWGDAGTDQVPLAVVIQVQHQMACTDAPGCHVARVFPGGFEDWFSRYYVPRNDTVIEGLMQTLSEWWERHIVKREPCPIGDKAPIYDVQKQIERTQGKEAEVPSDVFLAAYEARTLRLGAQKDEEAKMAVLMQLMDDATVAVCGADRLVLADESAGKRVNLAVLKEKYPEVYEAVAEEGRRQMPRWKFAKKK